MSRAAAPAIPTGSSPSQGRPLAQLARINTVSDPQAIHDSNAL
jgi:hypothetical protein